MVLGSGDTGILRPFVGLGSLHSQGAHLGCILGNVKGRHSTASLSAGQSDLVNWIRVSGPKRWRKMSMSTSLGGQPPMGCLLCSRKSYLSSPWGHWGGHRLVIAGKSGGPADKFPFFSGWSGNDGRKAVSALPSPGLCIAHLVSCFSALAQSPLLSVRH